jgi:hypothetical protein
MQQLRGPFPFIFRAAAGTVALSISLVLVPTTASAQTIYKWVDQHGVVNYGNADVPKTADAKVSVVDTTPPVTAQPGAKPRDTAARPSPSRLSDADMLREELMRSREEVARLRQSPAAAAKSNSGHGPDGFPAWRDACEQQHRTDCDETTYNAEGQTGGLSRQPAAVRQPVTYAPRPAVNGSDQGSLQVVGSAKPVPMPKPAGAGPITTMQ